MGGTVLSNRLQARPLINGRPFCSAPLRDLRHYLASERSLFSADGHAVERSHPHRDRAVLH
jgi:hypothetical protein